MMNSGSDSLADALRGQGKCEVFFDDLRCGLYASDASIYEVRPRMVAMPHFVEDVCRQVRTSVDAGVSVTARGAGTGNVGGCLNDGIIIDCSRHLTDIRQIDIEQNIVVAEAGCTISAINRRLIQAGKRLAGGIGGMERGTVGGMIARGPEAGGRYGMPAIGDYLCFVDAVLADSSLVRFWADGAAECLSGRSELLNRFCLLIPALLKDWSERIIAAPPFAGYHVRDAVEEGRVNWPRLLAGSEGTLAIIAAAGLVIEDSPLHTAEVIADFKTLADLTKAVPPVRRLCASACRMLDSTLLQVAREGSGLPAGAASLLVSIEAADEKTLALRQSRIVSSLSSAGGIIAIRELTDVRLQRGAREVFDGGLEAWKRLRTDRRPICAIDDVAVDAAELPKFLQGVYEIAGARQVDLICCGRIGNGGPSVYPLLDLREKADRDSLAVITQKAFELAWDCGGRIAGQRALGMARTGFLPDDSGELYELMRQIKQAFDPRDVLNPGKIISRSDSDVFGDSASAGSVDSSQDTLTSSLRSGFCDEELANWQDGVDWSPGEFAREAIACDGCGICRSNSVQQAMCPVHKAASEERNSPRAIANLARLLITGKAGDISRNQAEVWKVAENCINCGMCMVECPNGINIPKLACELKSASWSDRGKSRRNRIKASGEIVGKAAALQAAGREVSVADTDSGGSKPAPVVLLHELGSGGWGNELVSLAADILHEGGVEIVASEGISSAMASIVCGDVQTANEIVQKNVTLLKTLVGRGCRVVAVDPAIAWAICTQWQFFASMEDVAVISLATRELTAFVDELVESGKLAAEASQTNLSVAYHVSCRARALGIGGFGIGLIKRIGGVSVNLVDRGCCGMAGVWGMEASNAWLSAAAGEPMLKQLADLKCDIGVTDCAACKAQMSNVLTGRVAHPLQLFAWRCQLAGKNSQRVMTRIIKNVRPA